MNVEPNYSICKCNTDIEDKVEGFVESPLKTTPVEGITTWTDEKSTRVGDLFAWSLEDVMKDVPDHIKYLFERSRLNRNEEQSIVLTLTLTWDVFSSVQYRNDTGDSRPIFQQMHHPPLASLKRKESTLRKY